MESERFRQGEPRSEPDLVPDFIPDELLAAHQSEAHAVVAASLADRTVIPPDTQASVFISESTARAAAAATPRSPLQRVQAVLGILLGYVGLAALTGLWWSLAETQPDPMWWRITAIGVGGIALATLAIGGWALLRLWRGVQRWRARRVARRS